MADYRAIARSKAKKYGLDPNIFQRQIGAESNFNPRARSHAGAQGIAQIMPGTAKAWGVNPNDPLAALDVAAKNMAGYVKKYGSYERALRAYNAGEGAIDKSKGYAETNNYVRKILLGGRDPGKLSSGGGTNSAATRAATPDQVLPGAPTVDEKGFEQSRKEFMLGQLLAKSNPNNPLVKLGVLPNQAPTLDAFTKPGQPTVIPGQRGTSPTIGQGGGKGGARAALDWAIGKIGNPETGPNSGGLASFANQRFGMSGQPWCAMFTSLAVTKGGAPRSARTASVAEVRAKAQRGDGYVRGFVAPNRARAGDLIAFGTRHIGMVVSAKGNRVTMVAGNDSDRVQKRTVTLGADDKIVRPKYR